MVAALLCSTREKPNNARMRYIKEYYNAASEVTLLSLLACGNTRQNNLVVAFLFAVTV
jgi:hypothetical protein